jgi:hypothetical protein
MNLLRTIPALALTLPILAQDIAPKDAERDPILTELLDQEAPEPASDDAVLVTGTPPADATTIDENAEAPAPEPTPAADPPPPAETPASEEPVEKNGIRIEVQGGNKDVRIPASDIEIVAPFPAKPLSTPPAGWRLAHPDSVTAVAHEVTLNNGTPVKLSIRPHVLVPDADGRDIFALREPGFDSAKGYNQTDTIGAILAESIHTLDDHTDRLSEASQSLSELLDSLPAAPPVAEPAPEPTEP